MLLYIKFGNVKNASKTELAVVVRSSMVVMLCSTHSRILLASSLSLRKKSWLRYNSVAARRYSPTLNTIRSRKQKNHARVKPVAKLVNRVTHSLISMPWGFFGSKNELVAFLLSTSLRLYSPTLNTER